jgi:hypothetical protein
MTTRESTLETIVEMFLKIGIHGALAEYAHAVKLAKVVLAGDSLARIAATDPTRDQLLRWMCDRATADDPGELSETVARSLAVLTDAQRGELYRLAETVLLPELRRIAVGMAIAVAWQPKPWESWSSTEQTQLDNLWYATDKDGRAFSKSLRVKFEVDLQMSIPTKPAPSRVDDSMDLTKRMG